MRKGSRMGIYIDGIDIPDDGRLIDISIYSSGKVVKTWDLKNKEIAKAVPFNQMTLIDMDILKTGKWILPNGNLTDRPMAECDQCGWYVNPNHISEYDFCPHCGTKMEGEVYE